VRASRAKEVEGDTLIALNARALDWLESYFDRAYPFAKFDFLLAPAFPFGGMEHPGAVFYNEESFIFRERPTLVQRLGREATIFHEVAHQWFGDLVTMRWFDDLWLKEGFASYMAAVMQDAIDPQASAWKFFYLRNRPAAYQVDASLGTTPVWQSLANLDQAKSAYGAIVYNKAPGILKQLDHLVGDTAFRDGLRLYLHEHEYGNATWRDLLSAVGRAAHRDLAPWGAAYIQRAGMPVIEQQLVVKDGRLASLALVQHPAQPLSGHAPWPAKLDVVLGYGEGRDVHVPVELRGTRTVVPVVGRPAPEWVYANAGDYGYALVMLDARTVRWLEAHIGTVDDALQRAMLWGSLWDLVRDARWAPAKFVDLALRELPRERDEQITTSVLAHLSRAMEAYLSPARRDSLLPLVERTLAAQMADDSLSYGLRKVYLDALIANAGTPATLAHLDALLDSTTAVGAPLGEPTRWAIVTRLIATRAPSAASRAAMEARRDSTSEGRRRHFAALAATPDQEVKRKYWSAFFSPDINEEWATASLRAFDTPEQSELTLPYVVPALDSLPWIQRNRRIFFLGAWLGAFMDGQTSPDAAARVDRFLDEHRDLPLDLRQKILQAADELQRTVKIRQTFGVTSAEGAR
jgi:aminopeptidase N